MNRNLAGLVALVVIGVALLLTQEGGGIARLIGRVPLGVGQPPAVVELDGQVPPSSELAVGSGSTGTVVYEEEEEEEEDFVEFDEESDNADGLEDVGESEMELTEPETGE